MSRHGEALLFLTLGACASSADASHPSTPIVPADAAMTAMACAPVESSVSLDTGTGTLYGTLTSPTTCAPRGVAVILAGSGPTDRNGNGSSLDTDTYRMLAAQLADAGVVSVRYDKRGIAQSAPAGPSEVDLRFENYVDDARSWIRWLESNDSGLPLVLFGHSEGSLIAIVAAESEKVAAVVSLEGAGRRGSDVIREQLATKLSAADDAAASAILDQLAAGHTVAMLPPNLAMLFRPSVQPYLISWFAYDPAAEIGKLAIPAFIVQGTADIQTTLTDAMLLNEHATHGTLMLINGMTHPLKMADPADPQQTKAYLDPTVPLAPAFLTSLGTILGNLFGGDAGP